MREKRDRYLKFYLRSSDQLLFLHIPKTAGTSFYRVLSRHFEPGHFMPIPYEPLAEILDREGYKAVKDFKLLRTHDDYSIYRYFQKSPVFITMLRKPIERVVSLYHHVRRVPSHDLYEWAVRTNPDINQFIQHPVISERINNRQVRQLSGAIHGDAKRLSERAMLEVAQVRLDEFAFFGLVERFEDSVRLINHTFSWDQSPETPNLNADPGRSSRVELEREELTAIEQLNMLDLELYKYAEKEFERRFTQMKNELVRMNLDGQNEIKPIEIKSSKLPVHSDSAATSPTRIIWGWTIPDWIGRVRRIFIQPGSRVEEVYTYLRDRIMGW